VVRLWSVVLRAGALLALLLGIAVFAGWAPALVMVHMLLGLVVIVAAWALAVPELMAPGGNRGLAVAAVLLGILLPVVGWMQLSAEPGASRYAMQGLHVLLAVALVGTGEAAAARRRRGAAHGGAA
jgi:hypothetical protein